jgi:hypothetical protein
VANDLNPAALRPLYDACKAQHGAIDVLLAMLIERDKSFLPSTSTVWPVVMQANEALSKAVEQAMAAPEPKPGAGRTKTRASHRPTSRTLSSRRPE